MHDLIIKDKTYKVNIKSANSDILTDLSDICFIFYENPKINVGEILDFTLDNYSYLKFAVAQITYEYENCPYISFKKISVFDLRSLSKLKCEGCNFIDKENDEICELDFNYGHCPNWLINNINKGLNK